MFTGQYFLWTYVDVEREKTAVLLAPVWGKTARLELQEPCSQGGDEGE
jgi:hypothetical protein